MIASSPRGGGADLDERAIAVADLDHNGDTNSFDFTKLDATTKPDAKLFELSPKRVPTYRVIDV